MDDVAWNDALLRIGVAAVCGGAVGWERGRSDHPAGLRTQILISSGCAAFLVIALRWRPPGQEPFRVDHLRVLQGVLSGIGLLAAGTIIQARGKVHGFTTASSVWAVSAIGAASGFGYFDVAIILTVLTVIVTGVLVYIDPKEHGDQEEPPAVDDIP